MSAYSLGFGGVGFKYFVFGGGACAKFFRLRPGDLAFKFERVGIRAAGFRMVALSFPGAEENPMGVRADPQP